MRFARTVLPLLVAVAMAAPMPLAAQVSVDVAADIIATEPPPPIPVYDQPPLPGPDYIWEPGYWAFGPDGYYWVPGTWVLAPEPGLLWTPGFWDWSDGVYLWRAGYWGPHIGFYGGIDYGCGYFGEGYEGGHWDRGAFFYNVAVSNIGALHITNVYNKVVVIDRTVVKVSFHGGKGGTTARPTAQQQAALRERHVAPTALQKQHEHAARANRALRASVNHGKPAVAATMKAATFTGHGVVAAKDVRTTVKKDVRATPKIATTTAVSTQPHPPRPGTNVAHPPKLATAAAAATAIRAPKNPRAAYVQRFAHPAAAAAAKHPAVAARVVTAHPRPPAHQMRVQYHPPAPHRAAARVAAWHPSPVRPHPVPHVQARAPAPHPVAHAAPAARKAPRHG
jgi:hypothetical protein